MKTPASGVFFGDSPGDRARPRPFKGLAYFAEEDSASFGGRDRDVRPVASGILKSRTFLIYGRSGLGKTSLLQAGVFPELRRHGCRPVYVRALVDPLEDFRAALAEQLGGAPGDDIRKLVDDHDDDGPVVAVFDQFEELFIRFPAGVSRRLDERRRAFLQTLGRLAEDGGLNLRLVFSLREDWVAHMDDLERYLPGIRDASHRLLPLTAFGVRQAILQALKAEVTAFDARLVDALVDELAEVGFDPAVLQVVCSEVWEQAVERTPEGERVRLSLADMEKVGGIAGIFERYLDEVAREIPADDRRARIQTRAVLDFLITGHQTKHAVPYGDFVEAPFAFEWEELDRILERLCRHRLVRPERRGEDDWFELIHERLIPTLRDWLDADDTFWRFRAAINQVESACANPWQENPGLLLNREQLDGTVGPFKDELRLGDEHRRFLLSSAIYCGSGELEAWAAKAGGAVSVELVEGYLGDAENASARIGAARAAGQMTVERERFADRCLKVALEDPEKDVRREAARSFALLAGGDDLQDLASRLRPGGGWRRASEVFLEVVDHGLPAEHPFTFWQLLWARWRLRRRRLESIAPAVRVRGLRGAWVGAVAAFVLGLVPGALMVRMVLAELLPGVPTSTDLALLVTLTLSQLVSVLHGSLVGWLAARREAQAAFLADREGRLGSSLFSWPMVAAFLVPFVTLSAYELAVVMETIPAFSWWADLLDPSWFLIALAMTALAWPFLLLWIGGIELLMRPLLFRLASRRWLLYPWAILWAAGGALFLPLLGFATFDVSRIMWADWIKSSGDSAGAGAWLFGVGILFLHQLFCIGPVTLFSGALAIVHSSPASGASLPRDFRLGERGPQPAPAPLRWASALGGAVLTAGALWLVYQAVGFDSLPVFADKKTLAAGGAPLEIEPAFRAGFFDTDWTRLEVESEVPLLARLEVDGILDVYRSGAGRLPPHRYLLLPPGSMRLAVQRSWERRRDDQGEQGARIRLVHGAAAEESPLALRLDDWRMVTVPLAWRPEEEVWRGRLLSRTPGGPGDRDRDLRLEVSPVVRPSSSEPEVLRWCREKGFTLTVGEQASRQVRCDVQAREMELQSLPAPEGLRGAITLDLELRPENGSRPPAGGDATLHAFLRLGWYPAEPPEGWARAPRAPEELCDPLEPACRDQLQGQLSQVRQQIDWLAGKIEELEAGREGVLREELLDELVAGTALEVLKLEGIESPSDAERAELEQLKQRLATGREALEPLVDQLLREPPEPGSTAPAEPTAEAAEAFAQEAAPILARPSFRLRLERRRQALGEELRATEKQQQEEEAKWQSLREWLDRPGLPISAPEPRT